MPTPIYPEDLVFPAGADGIYNADATTVVTQARMSVGFSSRARKTRDFLNYSVVCNILPFGSVAPKGELSLWVTNASFSVTGTGAISFSGAVDWVKKQASVISVGGIDSGGAPITPPFDLAVGLNSWGAVLLRYVPTSGDGLLYAKLQGIGG